MSKAAKSGDLIRAERPDSAGESVTPPPRRAKRLRLATARDVKRELCAVYVDARYNGINSQHCARLAYLLGEIRRAIETSELEQRVAELERHADR